MRNAVHLERGAFPLSKLMGCRWAASGCAKCTQVQIMQSALVPCLAPSTAARKSAPFAPKEPSSPGKAMQIQ